jgi:hypothetical protein
VNFKITPHSGYSAPENALELLWDRLGTRQDGVSFAKGLREIRATWGEDVPVAMERDERQEVGRATVLGIVCNVCEQAPELKSDWFAVGPRR